ncbi:MAG TPA: Flp family type IVb pilin [Acidimicrobiia bacterium]|nr:Flp family type IVb pilin [Acidimicrobiia bacterium]
MYARFLIFKSKLTSTEIGASMVEYALLVMLIAIVALVAVQLAGQSLSSTYVDIANSFD